MKQNKTKYAQTFLCRHVYYKIPRETLQDRPKTIQIWIAAKPKVR